MKSAEAIVEEILSQQPISYEITWLECIVIARQAMIEAIRECAEAATLDYRVYHKDGTTIGTDMGQEVIMKEPNEYVGVNKQSILSLLNQIQ